MNLKSSYKRCGVLKNIHLIGAEILDQKIGSLPHRDDPSCYHGKVQLDTAAFEPRWNYAVPTIYNNTLFDQQFIQTR